MLSFNASANVVLASLQYDKIIGIIPKFVPLF